MHLLHVISSMDPVNGGPSQGIRNLDLAMRNEGVVREVVCLDPPDSSYLSKDEFTIHALGPWRSQWRYSSKLIPWLYANVNRFDIIIINGLWAYHSYAAWKVLHELKNKFPAKKMPKVLVMPHGMLDPYFQRTKERWLKAIRNWVYWKLIEGNVVNDADGLLFTCQTELLLARETFVPYHPKKEYNAGYGIKPPPGYHHSMSDAFYERCPQLKGVPYLLFLGRIHPKKGVRMLTDMYAEVYKARVSAGLTMPTLVIAGPGWNSEYGKLLTKQLSRTPEMRSVIYTPDMLTDDAKWGAFYGCEAFVLPSHQENFGIAVVEALACAKPVLISDQVNIWREVADGGAGLVENDNDIGVKNLLTRWMEMTDKEKAQMGKAAKNVYLTRFTVDQIVKNYMTAFSGR